jgi:hypothetical protein
MTEMTGFDVLPGWLPPAAARSVAEAERVCARQARQADAEREARRESSRSRAIESYRSQAELRGEYVSAVALATGQGLGRPISAVFAEAQAQADIADARETGRVRREGTGPVPQLEHIDFDEPVLHHAAARSGTGLAIFNRARHFRDRLAARRAAEAAEATRDYLPLRQPVRLP